MDTVQINNDSPVSYLFLTATVLSAWLHNFTKDDITFIITIISGLAAFISFCIKSYKDIIDIKRRKKDEQNIQ